VAVVNVKLPANQRARHLVQLETKNVKENKSMKGGGLSTTFYVD